MKGTLQEEICIENRNTIFWNFIPKIEASKHCTKTFKVKKLRLYQYNFNSNKKLL